MHKEQDIKRELVQDQDYFALWKIYMNGVWFYWSEAKRPNYPDAIGPTDQEAQMHFQFLVDQQEKWRIKNATE